MRPLFAVLLTLAAGPAVSQPAQSFLATDSCGAPRAKDGPINPGDVRLEAGRTYALVEGHRRGDDHVRLRVPGAPEIGERWVRTSCGTVTAADLRPVAPRPNESTANVLALNWQPAFCETQPNPPECRLLNRGGLPEAATRFSLHGLWPQPRDAAYCDGITARDALPRLSTATRGALDDLMPGTMSGLDRHEWTKHGSCYRAAGGAEEYFADSIRLTEAMNASPVREAVAGSVGGEVEAEDVRAAFDAAFGAGAGDRVELDCARDGRRTILLELRIHLDGVVTPDASLYELILAAPPAPRGDCRTRVVVDAAGLQ